MSIKLPMDEIGSARIVSAYRGRTMTGGGGNGDAASIDRNWVYEQAGDEELAASLFRFPSRGMRRDPRQRRSPGLEWS
jgi:hypothetical protein